MLVTDDEALAARAKHLTTQAKVPDIGYLHDEVGYNYRLTNVAAALGIAQLERLPDFVAAQARGSRARYDAAFAGSRLTLPPRLDGYDATYWLYSVLVPGSPDGPGRAAGASWAAGDRGTRAVAATARPAAVRGDGGSRRSGRPTTFSPGACRCPARPISPRPTRTG